MHESLRRKSLAARSVAVLLWLLVCWAADAGAAPAAAEASGKAPSGMEPGTQVRLDQCFLEVQLPLGFRLTSGSQGATFFAARGPGSSLLLATCRENAWRTFSRARLSEQGGTADAASFSAWQEVPFGRSAPGVIFEKLRVRDGRRLRTHHLFSCVRDFEYRFVLIANGHPDATGALLEIAQGSRFTRRLAPALPEERLTVRALVASAILAAMLALAAFFGWRRLRRRTDRKSRGPKGSTAAEPPGTPVRDD